MYDLEADTPEMMQTIIQVCRLADHIHLFGFMRDSVSQMRLEEQANIIAALTQAHKNLDLAVDKAYRKEKFKDEAERVAFLFERYGEMA
ncbi:hypothetical protein NKT77_02135 [Moraxella sp. FZLJ2107]|nr:MULTISPECIES: type IIL restriction-modification enzyme MmeI [unclassified Moraxella]UTO05476.1 hypothetical protein NKT77_02135 [Moraxella sp. FZLJ2107]UTO22212.1 hypothetical protein NKU06_10440 [Moraxella sp. FZLJ2109]